MNVSHNLNKLKSEIGNKVTLVAVSKTKPNELILDAYNSGHKDFGENKVQDLTAKYEVLPKDINWHYIGHLQTNKVKYIAPFVYLIHAVDSLKLLRTINKEAEKNKRSIKVLLQLKIAAEDSKFGLYVPDLMDILQSDDLQTFNNIQISGLMGMATYTDNKAQIQSEFNTLTNTFNQVKNTFFPDKSGFNIISMGMSGDYDIAINCGSNMVRIGSLIFGERVYKK